MIESIFFAKQEFHFVDCSPFQLIRHEMLAHANEKDAVSYSLRIL